MSIGTANFKAKPSLKSIGGDIDMIKKVPIKRILSKQIRSKRKDMYMQAQNFGFTHPTVVETSQELDILLNRYQAIQQAQ